MGSPLRILHVVVNMNRGGAETLLMNLYRNIDRTKIQFDFLTCKEGLFDIEIKELGGIIHRIPYVTDVGHIGYLNALDNFFKTHQEYKLVHSHMDKMSGFVLKAARKANIPVRIAHSHNTQSEGGLAAKAYKWYAGSKIQNAATHLYACSTDASRWLYGENFKQATLLRNGIECEKFQFSQAIRNQVRTDLQIKESTLVLGHVGRFNHQKNHSFLIDVFEKVQKVIPDSILLLAGDGSLLSDIKRKVNELHLSENVRFLGVRSDIHRLLQAFDMFVFPSFHEGLPVTLVEAQCAGLPCFLSDNITTEVDMGVDLVTYLSLTNAILWSTKIVDYYNGKKTRASSLGALSVKGYDIRDTARIIENSYASLLG